MRHMTAVYENFGVRFLYPENWQLTDEVVASEPKSVSVQSPGGGFWALHVYERIHDLESLAAEVIKNLRGEYQDIEQVPAKEQFGEVEASGYDLSFICLDFVVAAQVRCGTVEGRSFVVIGQAEDSEFERISLVFKAITHSWLASHS